MTNLLDYRRQVFSSSMGEDGIVEHIFDTIKSQSKVCVDIGAWDGIHLSNTRNLIVNHGWSSLQIECDPDRHEQLVKNYANYPVKTNCCFVDTDKNSIGRLIEDSGFDHIDFMNIDIDGPDYEIFNKMEKFLPTVLCIECSAGINPLDLEVLPTDVAYKLSGQGLGAMTQMVESKGYKLVVFVGNAFYVKNDVYPMLKIDDNSTSTIYQNFIDILAPDHFDYLSGWCNRLQVKNSFLLPKSL